jgi:hypothetical protein
MGIMIPRLLLPSACSGALLLALAGCASPPVHETQVVVMTPGAVRNDAALPPPGTTWRLDERELLALSPAPYVPPPPSPVPMPPRVVPAPLMAPYAAPYYGWGVPYYGPAFGFSFGYSYPRYTHRHRRR